MMPHNQIFNKKLEILNNFIPVLFFIIAVFTLWINHQHTRYELVLLNNIGNIIFFNTVHVVFTFIFLFYSLEFKYFIQQEKEKNNNLIKKWITASAILFLITVFVHMLLLTNFDKTTVLKIYTAYAFFYSTYAIYHGATQSYGITSIYNTTYSHEIAKKTKIIRLEKYFWHMLAGVHSAIGIFIFFKPQHLILITAVYFIFLTIIYIYLMCLNLINSKKLFKIKSIFFLRYLLYPLNFLSPVAAAGILSSHGLENIMVSEKIFRNGKFIFNLKKWYLALLCILMLGSILMHANGGLYAFYTMGHQPNEIWYAAVVIIMNTAGLTHFYIEGDIYKFKNDSVSKNQGHLILKM